MVSEIKNNTGRITYGINLIIIIIISRRKGSVWKKIVRKEGIFFFFNEKYIFVDYVIFVIIYTKQRNVTL